jgi:hypothetical protein
MLAGIRKMAAYVFAGRYSLGTAIFCATKAAYLTALIIARRGGIDRLAAGMNLAKWAIGNQEYNKPDFIQRGGDKTE